MKAILKKLRMWIIVKLNAVPMEVYIGSLDAKNAQIRGNYKTIGQLHKVYTQMVRDLYEALKATAFIAYDHAGNPVYDASACECCRNADSIFCLEHKKSLCDNFRALTKEK